MRRGTASRPRVARLAAAAIAAIAWAGAASAQLRISNPSLPPFERILYDEKVAKETGTVEQTIRLKAENGRRWYEYSSRSASSVSVQRLDPVTLFAFYSETTLLGPSSEVRRTMQVVRNEVRSEADELVVADAASLPVVLRGLPWGSANHARLSFLDSPRGRGSFSLAINVVGRETLQLGGKSYECWKVQLGVDGVIGALMGKTSLWYSVAPPHYLVRSEGLSGPPGSPQRILEIRSYESGPE
jgi:hypothetical protein